ncbi:putative transcription factor & chromatin remodeling &Metalloenzymes JmjC family [Helianthus anomalus]
MKHEWLERDNIVRRKGISVDEFVLGFETPNKPILLEGCLDKWPALKKWDRDYLVEVCGDNRFAVGPAQMTLTDYFVYSDQAQEERPLYLFDPKFANKVPQLGQDRLRSSVGSGSSFHIDPNSTSAWNAVVKGSKKWVLFPPDVVPPRVYPSSDGAEVSCHVSIT